MLTEPTIVTFALDDLPAAFLVQVCGLHQQAWPGPPKPETEPLHDPALRPLSLTLVADGRVLASLEILSKEIEHEGERYSASGLSAVVTDETLRGNGYGHRLCTAAREAMVSSGVDLGIFTCDRPLGHFYESAGFPILPGAVLVGGTPSEPFPSDQWDKVTLAAFFSARARQNADRFLGARIALYPGDIDKLW